MTEDELIAALLARRADAGTRIDMDTVPVPDLYPTAREEAIGMAERRIGKPFPRLLERLYREVGNGGFGPGAGLLGLEDGHPDAEGRTLVERYEWLMGQAWPAGLLPLFDWGDGSWSCIDLANSNALVETMDEFGRTDTPFSLASWLEDWTAGVDLHAALYEVDEVSIMNPFTRKPMLVKRRARPKGRYHPDRNDPDRG